MERSKAGKKEKRIKFRQPKLSLSKYDNNKQYMVVFYKIWKKYGEIQLTKNKMNLNNWKMKSHPPSPG